MTMREFRNQLKKMGEIIANSTHMGTILRNIPESWWPVTQTIRMIRIPDEIEESLKAHKADLNALEISDQAATAFIAWAKPLRPQNPNPVNKQPYVCSNEHIPSSSKPVFTCNNCGKTGHLVARCYAPGGGLEGQVPWMKHREPTHLTSQRPVNLFFTRPINNSIPRQLTNTIWLADQKPNSIIMMARIDKPCSTTEDIKTIIMNAETTANEKFTWLIHCAVSSHISSNRELFHDIHTIQPVKIDIANRESFTTNQWGTIRVKIVSDPHWRLEDLLITLTDVIYVPKLKNHLLSVGRMINSNISVHFGKYAS